MIAKDNLEKRLEDLGRTIGSDDSLLENVMSRIDAEPIGQADRFKNTFLIRRFIMSRFTKLAAVAVIIIIILGGVTLWPSGGPENGKWWLGPSAAWGQEILEALDTIKGVTCREQTVLVMADGSRHTSSTWDIFYVSKDSYRRDIYDSDVLREIQWYVPDGNDMIIGTSVRFDLESYFISGPGGGFGNYDAVERMRFYVRFLDKADKLLGEKIIEDRNCVGFEISASKYGNNPKEWFDCIWFDVETKLPVRIEKHNRPVTEHPEITFTTIQDQFNYNPELPADTFIPEIPESFIYGHPDEIRATKEKE